MRVTTIGSTAIDRLGLFAALTAAATWASTGIFVRLLEGMSAPAIVLARCLVALLAVVGLLIVSGRAPGLGRTLRSPLTWLLGSLMIAYYLLAVAAFQMAPVAEVTLLITVSPLFALAFRLLRRHPVPGRELQGSLTALVGVLVILSPQLQWDQSLDGRLLGGLLALAGAAVMAAYALLYSSAGPTAPGAMTVALVTFVLGVPALAAWLVLSNGLPGLETLTDLRVLALLVTLGLVATVVPTLAYSAASRRLSSVLTTSTRLLTPVIAAALGLALLGEMPDGWFWSGSVLVVGGLGMMLRPER